MFYRNLLCNKIQINHKYKSQPLNLQLDVRPSPNFVCQLPYKCLVTRWDSLGN